MLGSMGGVAGSVARSSPAWRPCRAPTCLVPAHSRDSGFHRHCPIFSHSSLDSSLRPPPPPLQAIAWPCATAEDAAALIAGASEPSASHNCWAWKVRAGQCWTRGRTTANAFAPLAELTFSLPWAVVSLPTIVASPPFAPPVLFIPPASPVALVSPHACPARLHTQGWVRIACSLLHAPPACPAGLHMQVGQQYRSSDDGEPGGTAGGAGLKARYPTTLQWDTLQMDGQVVTLLRDACVPV